ncbi:MAG: four helix bundle protein [Desulfuromonadales bacterium]
MVTNAKRFEDLNVWKKAHNLVLAVYRLSMDFPATERYGLTSQLRRSMVSVPANIAEGFKKRGRADKFRYMNIAQGSLEESRYYLILAQDLGYGDTRQLRCCADEVGRLLSSYAEAIKSG